MTGARVSQAGRRPSHPGCGLPSRPSQGRASQGRASQGRAGRGCRRRGVRRPLPQRHGQQRGHPQGGRRAAGRGPPPPRSGFLRLFLAAPLPPLALTPVPALRWLDRAGGRAGRPKGCPAVRPRGAVPFRQAGPSAADARPFGSDPDRGPLSRRGPAGFRPARSARTTAPRRILLSLEWRRKTAGSTGWPWQRLPPRPGFRGPPRPPERWVPCPTSQTQARPPRRGSCLPVRGGSGRDGLLHPALRRAGSYSGSGNSGSPALWSCRPAQAQAPIRADRPATSPSSDRQSKRFRFPSSPATCGARARWRHR